MNNSARYQLVTQWVIIIGLIAWTGWRSAGNMIVEQVHAHELKIDCMEDDLKDIRIKYAGDMSEIKTELKNIKQLLELRR